MRVALRLVIFRLFTLFPEGIVFLRHCKTNKVPRELDPEREPDEVGIDQCARARIAWERPFPGKPVVAIDSGVARTAKAVKMVCADAIALKFSAPAMYFRDKSAPPADEFERAFEQIGYRPIADYMGLPNMRTYFTEYAEAVIQDIERVLDNERMGVQASILYNPILVLAGHALSHQAIALMMAEAMRMNPEIILEVNLGEAEALLMTEERVTHLRLPQI